MGMLTPSFKNRFSKEIITEDMVEPNTTINQLNTTDTYRLFHPITAEHTPFSRSHETYTKGPYSGT